MHAHIVPKTTYYRVAINLFALLLLTLVVAEFNLGILNTPLAIIIAMVKAALIVLFFMHVRYGSPLLHIFAAGGFLWLIILFVLTFSDYVTRDKPHALSTATATAQAAEASPPPTVSD